MKQLRTALLCAFALTMGAGIANAIDEAKDADNTARNVRDRSDAVLDPLDQGNSESDRTITQQIRKAWSQEPSIEIKLNVNGNMLYIDISDGTTVFDTPESRSLGFRWYLSFYINFLAQTVDSRGNDFVFLVDEAGIHLHPAGQKDLVKVMEDLSAKNQIVYTTHSPFMINREFPQRVRLVLKDKDGTRVDSEAYRENWKPLRSSIGLMISDLFFFSERSMAADAGVKKFTFLRRS